MSEEYKRIVSLGWNCEPAMDSVKFKLKRRKSQGYETCPFDLCITPYESLLSIFENDFEGFTDPSVLEMDEKTGWIRNTRYNTFFNHESPNHFKILAKEKWSHANVFIEHNFTEYCRRYNKRIASLKKYIAEGSVIFIIECYNMIPADLSRIIKEKYPALHYTIVARVNTTQTESIRSSYKPERFDKPIQYKNGETYDENIVVFNDTPSNFGMFMRKRFNCRFPL